MGINFSKFIPGSFTFQLSLENNSLAIKLVPLEKNTRNKYVHVENNDMVCKKTQSFDKSMLMFRNPEGIENDNTTKEKCATRRANLQT